MTRLARRTIAFVVGVLTWLVVFYLAAVLWDDFVEATGDTLDECDRGECGTLGEFSENHDFILFLMFVVGTGLVGIAVGWLTSRALRLKRR